MRLESDKNAWPEPVLDVVMTTPSIVFGLYNVGSNTHIKMKNPQSFSSHDSSTLASKIDY